MLEPMEAENAAEIHHYQPMRAENVAEIHHYKPMPKKTMMTSIANNSLPG